MLKLWQSCIARAGNKRLDKQFSFRIIWTNSLVNIWLGVCSFESLSVCDETAAASLLIFFLLLFPPILWLLYFLLPGRNCRPCLCMSILVYGCTLHGFLLQSVCDFILDGSSSRVSEREPDEFCTLPNPPLLAWPSPHHHHHLHLLEEETQRGRLPTGTGSGGPGGVSERKVGELLRCVCVSVCEAWWEHSSGTWCWQALIGTQQFISDFAPPSHAALKEPCDSAALCFTLPLIHSSFLPHSSPPLTLPSPSYLLITELSFFTSDKLCWLLRWCVCNSVYVHAPLYFCQSAVTFLCVDCRPSVFTHMCGTCTFLEVCGGVCVFPSIT